MAEPFERHTATRDTRDPATNDPSYSTRRCDPGVLAAFNPWYAIQFLLSHGTIGMVTLGAVFLAVTGGEALSQKPELIVVLSK